MQLTSAFDGSFYPGEPEVLQEWVDEALETTPRELEGEPFGAIVPHAGYVYSGRTAARAIGALEDRAPGSIVLMGPSHRVAIDGVRVFDVEGYQTPLGSVPCDRDLAAKLQQRLGPRSQGEAFPEHSVEVQLPLIRRALPSCRVVEMIFGPPDWAVAQEVGEVLARLWREEGVLAIASSDLSHYFPLDEAAVLDGRFRRLLEAGDPEEMARALSTGATQACGAGPVLGLMEMTRNLGGRFQVLHQTDSSEASGDRSQVVGYLSALAVGNERR